MSKFPRISSRKLIALLIRLGFFIHHQRGSHIHLCHITKKHLRIVVPVNRQILAPKTLKTILIQAELSVEDIINHQ